MVTASRAPWKNCSMSIELGASSSAPVLANSPIQVEPTQEMSGVLLPAIEVRILLCACSIAIGVTLTFTPGFSFSKSRASSGSFSPSTPGAQTVIVALRLRRCGVDLVASASVSAAAGDQGRQRGDAAAQPGVRSSS